MRKHILLLTLIFLLALGFRLYFVFQTDTLDPDAYFNLRQVESIKQTGLPIFHDELSYGGRSFIFMPIFQYLLAIFCFFMPPITALKAVPALMASSIVIINYLIAKKITNDENSSLFCAFISAFIPVFILETVNSASIYSAVIPLTFLSLYFFIDIEEKGHAVHFIISAFLLTIMHPSSSLLILGLLLYLLMMRLEKLSQKKAEIETVLFLTFFSLWISILIYKKAFLSDGAYVIWQNIPSQVMSLYFAQTNILDGVVKMGLVPIILGGYIFYRYVLKEKNKEIYAVVGMALACFSLVWLRLLQPNIAFMFLGAILAIFLAQGYKLIFDYLKKTKFAVYERWFIALIVAVFFITSIVPSFYFIEQKMKDAPSQAEIEALTWIKENTKEEDVIAGSLKEGHMINGLAERKNMIDTNFLLVKDAEQRVEDIKTIYRSKYKTEAIPLLNKYDIKYILFSDYAKSEFDVQSIDYIDEECFKLVFEKDDAKVYKALCKVEEV